MLVGMLTINSEFASMLAVYLTSISWNLLNPLMPGSNKKVTHT